MKSAIFLTSLRLVEGFSLVEGAAMGHDNWVIMKRFLAAGEFKKAHKALENFINRGEADFAVYKHLAFVERKLGDLDRCSKAAQGGSAEIHGRVPGRVKGNGVQSF